MIRWVLLGVCVVLCVALQLGLRDISAAYELNYNLSAIKRQPLHWTDIYAPHDIKTDFSLLAETTKLLREESFLSLSSSSLSWHTILNHSGYAVESIAMKSNSISVRENPMIRILMEPLPCHSAKHMLQMVTTPHSLMSTFFPLFHASESEPEAAFVPTDPVKEDGNMKEDGVQKLTSVEFRTVVAPLIWPLEERNLTLLSWSDAVPLEGLGSEGTDWAQYFSRSLDIAPSNSPDIDGNSDGSRADGLALDTTSLSLVVDITSSSSVKKGDVIDSDTDLDTGGGDRQKSMSLCTCRILYHSANILPHATATYYYHTEYLSRTIAQLMAAYSDHFYPEPV